MNSARAILQLQKSASEEELLANLQPLTMQRLKFLCKETAMKCSGVKAKIIGRLISSWKKLCDLQSACESEGQQRAASSTCSGLPSHQIPLSREICRFSKLFTCGQRTFRLYVDKVLEV